MIRIRATIEHPVCALQVCVDQKKKNLISENIRFPKIKPTQAKKTTDAMLLQLIHFSLPLIV
jgi:hypothetical protein